MPSEESHGDRAILKHLGPKEGGDTLSREAGEDDQAPEETDSTSSAPAFEGAKAPSWPQLGRK